MDANLSPYLPVVLALGVALFLGIAMVGINAIFGPKRKGKVHTDPFACDLLDEFEKLTGVPIIINTSFNRHEQPIIRRAPQALEELERGVVDTLVLEDCIVRRKEVSD